jgi:ubiquinone/menaquinone biosynthesis C-methylase UbiE
MSAIKVKSYSALAEYYDLVMNQKRYKKWQKLVGLYLKKYQIKKEAALDIACGTGRISKILKDLGFKKVVGVDISGEMLKVARKKYPSIKFIQSDMRNYKLRDKFDLIVCFYDSLNYLTAKKDIQMTFKNIAHHLKDEGIFIFDMNTFAGIKIKQSQPDQSVMVGLNKIIFKSSGRGNLWKLDIKIIKADGKVLAERHVERGYSLPEINSLLLKAHFKPLDIQKEICYFLNRKQTSRLYIIARKQRNIINK